MLALGGELAAHSPPAPPPLPRPLAAPKLLLDLLLCCRRDEFPPAARSGRKGVCNRRALRCCRRAWRHRRQSVRSLVPPRSGAARCSAGRRRSPWHAVRQPACPGAQLDGATGCVRARLRRRAVGRTVPGAVSSRKAHAAAHCRAALCCRWLPGRMPGGRQIRRGLMPHWLAWRRATRQHPPGGKLLPRAHRARYSKGASRPEVRRRQLPSPPCFSSSSSSSGSSGGRQPPLRRRPRATGLWRCCGSGRALHPSAGSRAARKKAVRWSSRQRCLRACPQPRCAALPQDPPPHPRLHTSRLPPSVGGQAAAAPRPPGPLGRTPGKRSRRGTLAAAAGTLLAVARPPLPRLAVTALFPPLPAAGPPSHRLACWLSPAP
jgi:hypothetical protein